MLTVISAAAPAAEAPSPWLVSLLGLGTVFVGLMALIGICFLMGLLFRTFAEKKVKQPETKETAVPAVQEETVIPDRGAFVAAVSAALAEEMGTDVAGLRIVSIRRM